MAKRKPLEVKRVAIAPLVAPITKDALKRLAVLSGLSQGELIDDVIAGTVQAYADRPLEDGETYARTEPIDLAMVERATTRVPVVIEAERPAAVVGTVTAENAPSHLASGSLVAFTVPSVLDDMVKLGYRRRDVRGIRQKGDSNR